MDLLGDIPEWQELALCRQVDAEMFFPEKGGSTKDAKAVCSRCEVRVECRGYALSHNERTGVWGGLSERERRQLKRQAACPPSDTCVTVVRA
jgi:WhiB family redox-sensing transcriptional regulator